MRIIHAGAVVVLACAALGSGLVATRERLALREEWQRLSPAEQESVALGPYAAVVRKVKSQVAEQESLLLVAGVDPALLPYSLFPRKIWQQQVEPETNALYMVTLPPLYPKRPAESFAVDWRLEVRPETLEQGGVLVAQRRGGR